MGIWWTIGLTSPLATEVLIRTFVFGWATEWVFFVVELVSAFIFLYYWDRLAEKTHVAIGWIYAAAAWISLVLITGITAFMLNSGRWPFQPGLAQLLGGVLQSAIPAADDRPNRRRTAAELALRLSARLVDDPQRQAARHDRRRVRRGRPCWGRFSSRPAASGWYAFLPDTAAATLASAAVLNVLMALIFALTAVVFVLLYMGPYRNPGWLSPGFAGSLCLFGIAAFTTGEFIREAVRKPFVVNGVVLANQVLPKRSNEIASYGYLDGGVWTKAYVDENYLKTIGGRPVSRDEVENSIRESKLHGGPQLEYGMMVPHEGHIEGTNSCCCPRSIASCWEESCSCYHCNDCHAEQARLFGRRAAVAGAIAGRQSSTGSNTSTTTTSCRPGAAPTKRPNCWPII